MNAEQFGALLMNLADMTEQQRGLLLACLKGAADFDDKRLCEMNVDKLSTRARKVLHRTGVTMRSQISREILQEQRTCGTITANEILDWTANQ